MTYMTERERLVCQLLCDSDPTPTMICVGQSENGFDFGRGFWLLVEPDV